MADYVVKPEHGYWIHRERPFAIAIEKLFTKLWNRFIEPSNLGLFPKEYNKNIHGPYVPYRYYGKPDTPFSQVKLGELGAWIRRRNKRPVAMFQAIGRTYHWWVNRFYRVRYPNFSPVWQACITLSVVMYIMRYSSLHSIHTRARYH